MLFFPVFAVDHAFDSVSQLGDMEVNEQSDSDTAQPHVRHQLRLMNRMDRLDAFHLDNDEGLDDQVDPVSQLDPFVVVNHRQPDLAGDSQAAFAQFMSKASLISALQQPRSEQRMNSHRTGNDCTADLVRAESCGRSHPTLIPDFPCETLCSPWLIFRQFPL